MACLLSCHQGSRCVAEFTEEFRRFAANSGWQLGLALSAMFTRGLTKDFQDEPAIWKTRGLEALIALAIKMEARLR